MGDLGLTLRAAAISWSWLTNSVMDRRSSGFTFNMEPGQQGGEEIGGGGGGGGEGEGDGWERINQVCTGLISDNLTLITCTAIKGNAI